MLVGQRVQIEGSANQGAMQAARTRIDDFSDLVGASRLSIEAYVQRAGSSLQLGSGFVARDSSRFGPAAEARMVVNAPAVGHAANCASNWSSRSASSRAPRCGAPARRIGRPAERRATTVADPMSPAAAALMRPAGVVRVLASPPAAVLADPAVALVPQVAVPVASVVQEGFGGPGGGGFGGGGRR